MTGGIVATAVRLLVVDDNADNCALLEILLTADGFVVETAADGESALACIERRAPDVVLLDLMMPDMDGWEVTRRIKANPMTRALPVIIVSGLNDARTRSRSLSNGAAGFVGKPIDRAQLCMLIWDVLRQPRVTDGAA